MRRRASATLPATMGDANEVPDHTESPPSQSVLLMPVAGADERIPLSQLLNTARVSSGLSPATAMTLLIVAGARANGRLLLPAAATTSTLRVSTQSITSVRAGMRSSEPRLMFTTSAPLTTEKASPLISHHALLTPSLSATLAMISLVSGAV